MLILLRMSTAIHVSRNIFSKASSRNFMFLIRRGNTTASNSQATQDSKASSSNSSSSSPLPKNEYYDIVVVGGGMVGTAMAKVLGFTFMRCKMF